MLLDHLFTQGKQYYIWLLLKITPRTLKTIKWEDTEYDCTYIYICIVQNTRKCRRACVPWSHTQKYRFHTDHTLCVSGRVDVCAYVLWIVILQLILTYSVSLYSEVHILITLQQETRESDWIMLTQACAENPFL